MNDLVLKVGLMRNELKTAHGRIILGKAFESSMEIYSRLKSEEESRKKELVSFEEDFLASEEARETLSVALDLLKRRRIVSLKNDEVAINMKRAALLEFYSNSLSHLLH